MIGSLMLVQVETDQNPPIHLLVVPVKVQSEQQILSAQTADPSHL